MITAVCGILGIISGGALANRVAAAEAGLAALSHRGPDDAGLIKVPEDGGAGGLQIILANARLAVVDLSPSGRMPMAGHDGRLWITYNGEVYNFRELRSELEGLGHSFRSTGDTEVVLTAYEEWGDGFLGRLNGMFAIAIADYRRQTTRFLLARDRLGIKPCYYTWRGGELFFASEMKALRAAGALPSAIDWQGIADYFTYSFVPGPRTAYVGCQQLPPGHMLEWRAGEAEPKLRRYWSPLMRDSSPLSFATTLDDSAIQLRDLLRDSVRRELVSDVPTGVFLSGGIDSTILTALAAAETVGTLKTFTVVFEGSGVASVDDRDHARRVSARYGTDHQEISVDISEPEEMLDLACMFDQPFGNPTYYLSYLISQQTRRHVTVALSGAGGDELFAGYPRYRALPFAGLLRRTPAFVGVGARMLLSRWPENYDDLRARRVKLLMRGVGEEFPEQYLRWAYYASDIEKAELLGPLYARERGIRPAVRLIEELLSDARVFPEPGTRVQYVDLMTFLPDNVLEYTDRTTMAASLEARVPFLDHRLVEWSFRLPFIYKLRGRESKRVLRRAFADLIPRENARAPKRGFCPPLALWMDRALDRYFESDLTKRRVEQVGVLSWPHIQRLRAEQRRGAKDNSMQLFAIIVFDRWWRRHVENRD